jgi:hypothetical protein
MTKGFKNNERGSSVVEVAMAAGVFFMLIFGIIEFGRLLYTHNALTDAARRGARYAALHHEVPGNTCVENAIIYGETHMDPVTCAPTGAPLLAGLTEANISVTYVGADLDGDPDTPQTSYGMNLGTATVSIQDYTFELSVPFVHRTLTMPNYATTLTAESAGEEPDPIP